MLVADRTSAGTATADCLRPGAVPNACRKFVAGRADGGPGAHHDVPPDVASRALEVLRPARSDDRFTALILGPVAAVELRLAGLSGNPFGASMRR
jgi:hypothetical protein